MYITKIGLQLVAILNIQNPMLTYRDFFNLGDFK
jgi:hypothetical protein